MPKQPLAVLTVFLACSGSGAWAASESYDPARLAGVWTGTRTTAPKGSTCSIGKRESDRVVPVRLTIEVKPDGTFIGTLATGPEYRPISPPWRGQIVAHIVEAVVPSAATCNGVPREYEVHLSGELHATAGKQTLGLEGQNAPCPQQKCLFQVKFELGRDE
jgi:hypothetical protein